MPLCIFVYECHPCGGGFTCVPLVGQKVMSHNVLFVIFAYV